MIFYIRHGITDYNLQKRTQGHTNNPLNKIGFDQTHAFANKTKNINFDIIYTSPLLRATQTAEIINKYHNVQIVPDSRICELDIGTCAGLVLSKKVYYDLFYNPHKYSAEDREFTVNRVDSFLKDISKNHKNQNILVVSHGSLYNIFKFLIAKKQYSKNKLKLGRLIKNLKIYKFKI